MSLTSHLKDKNSPITELFDKSFTGLEVFLAQENAKIADAATLLPTHQYQYPWAAVGHVAEYLLALHMQLDFTELLPMVWLRAFKPDIYLKLENFGLKAEHLQTHFETVVHILHSLALYEAQIRTYGSAAQFVERKISKLAVADLHNIYTQSICGLEYFNTNHQFYYNPHFDRSLSEKIGGADADLIEMRDNHTGFLIDLKTTKHCRLDRAMVYQLMGYTALDTQHQYQLDSIGIYFTRQAIVLEYSLLHLLNHFSTFSGVEDLRQKFKAVAQRL